MSDWHWVLEEAFHGGMRADFIQDKYWMRGKQLHDCREWLCYTGGAGEDPKDWELVEEGYSGETLRASFMEDQFFMVSTEGHPNWEEETEINRGQGWLRGGGCSVESNPEYNCQLTRETFLTRDEMIWQLAKHEQKESEDSDNEDSDEDCVEESDSEE